ncbi:hypothetical protein VPHPS32B4_0080 [Vibrio phage PS32B-4]
MPTTVRYRNAYARIHHTTNKSSDVSHKTRVFTRYATI